MALMYAVLYYMLGCAVVGAIGMAIANRKADAPTSRQRWLKYFVYIIITAVVVTAIYFDYLWIATSLILLAGWYEIIKALVNSGKKQILFKIGSFLIYAIIGTGFLIFSFELDSYFQLAVYLQVLMFDAFSQITGQIFGKTRLVPKISPAKTVEGAFGGFVVCIITSLAVGDMLGLDSTFTFWMGAITAVSALSGDLLASWFKRKMNIKDYSRLLPGQGGVLDRFDSFIAAGFVYFSLAAIAGIFFPLNPAP
jgi:phosphatidate cytidylyltransferase